MDIIWIYICTYKFRISTPTHNDNWYAKLRKLLLQYHGYRNCRFRSSTISFDCEKTITRKAKDSYIYR